jgi:hypothetical protein
VTVETGDVVADGKCAAGLLRRDVRILGDLGVSDDAERLYPTCEGDVIGDDEIGSDAVDGDTKCDAGGGHEEKKTREGTEQATEALKAGSIRARRVGLVHVILSGRRLPGPCGSGRVGRGKRTMGSGDRVWWGLLAGRYRDFAKIEEIGTSGRNPAGENR